jgi:nucleoside-diphosphate-sugar epimerase
VTARLFNVYGPGERPGRLLPSLIEAAAARRPVELTAGLQELDFVYVGDVAEGLLRLGAAAVPGGAVVNLATGVLTRARDFALAAADALGMPRELLLFGRLPARPAEMRYPPVNNARLRQLTGWAPVTTVAEGIGRTLRGMSYATR